MANAKVSDSSRKALSRRIGNSMHSRFAFSVMVRLASLPLALAVNALVARSLGVFQYGRYATLFSATMLLGGMAVGGIRQVVTRGLAAISHSGIAESEPLLHWAIARMLRTTSFAICVYAVWIAVSKSAPTLGAYFGVVSCGALLIATVALCALICGGLSGTGAEQKSQALPSIVQTAGLLLLFGGAVIVWGPPRVAVEVLWMQIGGYFIAIALGWIWLRSRIDPRLGTFRIRGGGRNRTDEERQWTKAARHFMIFALANQLNNRFDVVLVSMVSDERTTGIYAAAARLAQVAMVVALAVNAILLPMFAAAWGKRDMPQLRRLLRQGLVFTGAVALLQIAIVGLFAPEIVKIFGKGYAQAAAPFLWATVGNALWSACAPIYSLLSMTGHEKIVAAVSWGVLAVNASSIFILVPFMGATGGGVANTLGYAAALIAFVLMVPRILRSLQARSRNEAS